MSNIIAGPFNRSGGSIANGGEPPHDGGMEARVRELEKTCQTLREDVAVIRSNYATKADAADLKTELTRAGERSAVSIANVLTEVSRVESTVIKWTVGTAITIGSLAFAIAKFVT